MTFTLATGPGDLDDPSPARSGPEPDLAPSPGLQPDVAPTPGPRPDAGPAAGSLRPRVVPASDPSEDGGAALEAVDLVRTYGPVRAVDGVSFTLEPGRFLTVFGPNGAGKTTLLRMLGGGLHPSRGEVRIGGTVLRASGTDWRHRLGVLSHQSYLYGHLTAAENLRFYGTLYGLRDLATRVPERLREVELLSRADTPARALSRGMRQRLALARTLLHDPEVVLLDEPYTGLDAHAADVLRGVLSALKDGRRTVVLVTHNLTQGLELSDRIVIQVRGRWVYDRPRSAVDADSFEREYRGVVEGAETRG